MVGVTNSNTLFHTETYMASLQGKIRLGSYALATVVAALSAVVYLDLRFLEDQVESGVAVSRFSEHVLEMRRFEKNYLLYHSNDDLSAAFEHNGAAGEILVTHDELFAGLAPQEELVTLDRRLERYRALLEIYSDNRDGQPVPPIREVGRDISIAADVISERERATVLQYLRNSRIAVVISVLVVGAVGVLIGRLLSQAVVRSLRQLESNLEPIARGRFRALTAHSDDREIVSFTRAFNRMLGELEARRRQLLHSEKLASLGVLVSGVAHELNNPLSNISSSCQLLLEEQKDGDRELMQEWLEQIDEQTQRARGIVLALLDFSRNRPFATEPVLLSPLLEKVLLLLHKELKNVVVDTDVPPEFLIRVDSQRMQQVFINLIKNATDAGGPGTRVRVRAEYRTGREAAPAEDAYVFGNDLCPGGDEKVAIIRVEDDGPGIEAAILPKVFDPFFTTRETGHGMGLGLYIVEEIIREHDGCIAIRSREGVGCTFSIRLPAVESNR